MVLSLHPSSFAENRVVAVAMLYMVSATRTTTREATSSSKGTAGSGREFDFIFFVVILHSTKRLNIFVP